MLKRNFLSYGEHFGIRFNIDNNFTIKIAVFSRKSNSEILLSLKIILAFKKLKLPPEYQACLATEDLKFF